MNGIKLDFIKIPDDIPFLYKTMLSEDQYLYSTKLRFYSIQTFQHWLECRLGRDFHDFYIIRDSSGLSQIGYVHNYDFSLIDGHCKLVVYIISKYRETGFGGIAAIEFMKTLFFLYPLRKLFSTIYEYNKESLKSNLAAGFELEGIIKDYRYFDGKYHNIYYLSIEKEKFEKTIGKLVK